MGLLDYPWLNIPKFARDTRPANSSVGEVWGDTITRLPSTYEAHSGLKALQTDNSNLSKLWSILIHFGAPVVTMVQTLKAEAKSPNLPHLLRQTVSTRSDLRWPIKYQRTFTVGSFVTLTYFYEMLQLWSKIVHMIPFQSCKIFSWAQCISHIRILDLFHNKGPNKAHFVTCYVTEEHQIDLFLKIAHSVYIDLYPR